MYCIVIRGLLGAGGLAPVLLPEDDCHLPGPTVHHDVAVMNVAAESENISIRLSFDQVEPMVIPDQLFYCILTTKC